LGIRLPDPKVRPWAKEEDALLGTMRDEELAKRLGRSVMGIALRRQHAKVAKFGRVRTYWSVKEDRLLGTAPDEEIAKRLGRSQKSVTSRRFRLGIEKYGGG
jgi:hypothetical protein